MCYWLSWHLKLTVCIFQLNGKVEILYSKFRPFVFYSPWSKIGSSMSNVNSGYFDRVNVIDFVDNLSIEFLYYNFFIC